MTNQKLYALKTSDTGEWVSHNSAAWVTSLVPKLFASQHPALTYIVEMDVKHPCEWVEVWVIEAKAVDEYLSDVDTSIPQAIAWEKGFRDCFRYLGITE